jgi:hypothetical protein
LYCGCNLWSRTNPRAAFPGINNATAIFLRLQCSRSAIVHTSSNNEYSSMLSFAIYSSKVSLCFSSIS